MQSHQLTRPRPVGFFQSPNVASGGPVERTGIMQTHDELLEKFKEGYAKYGDGVVTKGKDRGKEVRLGQLD